MAEVPKKIATEIYDYHERFGKWLCGDHFLKLSNSKEIIINDEYKAAQIEYQKAMNKRKKKFLEVQDFIDWLNDYPLKNSSQKAKIVLEYDGKSKDERFFDKDVIEVLV
ncbi:MAG: hypothetical protein FWF76_05785 [Oscillospiraceae bacterium]|nr:hypothetical protein [Oscillospiraceae bacterium]